MLSFHNRINMENIVLSPNDPWATASATSSDYHKFNEYFSYKVAKWLIEKKEKQKRKLKAFLLL